MVKNWALLFSVFVHKIKNRILRQQHNVNVAFKITL